jgi:hypothetical protein
MAGRNNVAENGECALCEPWRRTVMADGPFFAGDKKKGVWIVSLALVRWPIYVSQAGPIVRVADHIVARIAGDMSMYRASPMRRRCNG